MAEVITELHNDINKLNDEVKEKDVEICQLKAALLKAYYRDARFHPEESQEMVKRARIFFENN
jgi:HEPN domain-containing protein